MPSFYLDVCVFLLPSSLPASSFLLHSQLDTTFVLVSDTSKVFQLQTYPYFGYNKIKHVWQQFEEHLMTGWRQISESLELKDLLWWTGVQSTLNCFKSHEANIPETTLCFIKIDFNIFAVCYTELYKNRVPPVVPLGSCWMPVKRQKTQKHEHM